MTRYAVMTGHECKRKFGWDCHGLPIEYEIDKTYKITSSAEREAVSKHFHTSSTFHICVDWCQGIQQKMQRNCHDLFKGMGVNCR